MRVGVFPSLRQASGGVYQYSLAMMDAMWQIQLKGQGDELVAVHWASDPPPVNGLLSEHWSWLPIDDASTEPVETSHEGSVSEMLRSIVGDGPHREAWRYLRDRLQPGWRDPSSGQTAYPEPDHIIRRPLLSSLLRNNSIDLMFYPVPSTLSFETDIPYVIAIHDLHHYFHAEFPEVSSGGEWERREYLFRNGARYAQLILVDSAVSGEDVITAYGQYGVTEDRIKVLPFVPAHYLDRHVDVQETQRVLDSYCLDRPYLFYPAQFWPHKNHANLVEALNVLKSEAGTAVDIVLTGSHSGEIREQTFASVMELASDLGVAEQLHYLGFVPEADMAGLYSGATALVMPTLIGPTYIPPLEAWSLGCPVITSDVRGLKEQMGNAAVLVDPRDPASIADGVSQLWNSEALQEELTALGKARLATYTPEDFQARLREIVIEATERVRSERSFSTSIAPLPA